MLNKAVIDLKNLVSNARKIKKSLSKGVKFCAVVKADAYGHGAEQVANALYLYVDYYAVALAEEGVSLRQSGIDKPILVLASVYPFDVEKAVDYNLTLTVCGTEEIKLINKVAKKKGKLIRVHLKYNSGMNRQGIDSLQDLRSILECAIRLKNVYIEGIYTHFGAPQNKRCLNRALNKFLLAINVCKGYNNKVIAHASASGGFLRGVEFDMVRIGLMLYGYTPFRTDKIRLKKVMRVLAPVLGTRKIKRGENCLYGQKKVLKKQKVDIVRYGYADGLNRKRIGSQINNRCMDISAYCSNINTKTYTIMDDAEEIAKQEGTITYEVLCKASIRAEKVYRR